MDAVYITTRYPDSIVGDLTPSEYFDEEDAEECIRCAELLIPENPFMLCKGRGDSPGIMMRKSTICSKFDFRIDIRNGEKVSEDLMNEISAFANAIRSEMDVDWIIVFGSFSRGDFNEGSDIDLLIVGNFKERFHKRYPEIAAVTDLPIEPVCYTKEELGELVRNKNPFILSILEEGIAV